MNWTMRKAGVEMATVRINIHISRLEYETLKRAALKHYGSDSDANVRNVIRDRLYDANLREEEDEK